MIFDDESDDLNAGDKDLPSASASAPTQDNPISGSDTPQTERSPVASSTDKVTSSRHSRHTQDQSQVSQPVPRKCLQRRSARSQPAPAEHDDSNDESSHSEIVDLRKSKNRKKPLPRATEVDFCVNIFKWKTSHAKPIELHDLVSTLYAPPCLRQRNRRQAEEISLKRLLCGYVFITRVEWVSCTNCIIPL